MIINQSKLVISRDEIKNLEYPNLKDIEFIETTELSLQSYYQSIITVVEQLLCS